MEPRGAGERRWPGLAARVAYLAVLVLATLTSVRLDLDPGAVAQRLQRMLVPSISARDAVDAARNVALFGGWGVVWVLTSPRRRTRETLRGAVVTGAAVSLAVELVQLLSWTRNASVLDLATNTLGALVGAGAVVLAVRALEARRGRRLLIGVPALAFAAAYAVVVLGEALVPLFRQWTLQGASGGPGRRFAAAAAQFEWSSLQALPTMDVLVFLPAGILLAVALVEEGVDRGAAAVWATVGGLALMVAAEVGHGFLGLPMVAGAALLHALAVGAGAFLGVWLLPTFVRRWGLPERPRLVLAGYAVTLLLWTFRPYRLHTSPSAVAAELTTDWWIPLRALSIRVDAFSVIDVVNGFLLYLPLGALLAVWPLRRGGALAGALPAVYLAVAAELAQLLVVGRTLDVTDILVQAAGAWVGWLLVRRAGFRPLGQLAPTRPLQQADAPPPEIGDGDRS